MQLLQQGRAPLPQDNPKAKKREPAASIFSGNHAAEKHLSPLGPNQADDTTTRNW
jgi:hypothetical protein